MYFECIPPDLGRNVCYVVQDYGDGCIMYTLYTLYTLYNAAHCLGEIKEFLGGIDI